MLYDLYEDLVRKSGQLYLLLKTLEEVNEYQGERAIYVEGHTVYIYVDGTDFQMSVEPGSAFRFNTDVDQ